ncbi:phospholipase D-like domain-containing protein [Lysinibacillus xylanilyticus]|uniref:hypothetical protein n=1 Tax=Lysinibacillus xylanilyticus TaxID=582475 RepID=UPI003804B404
MRRESEYARCKFVLTRGELAYSEVIDDFKNADFVYIVTYNISRNDETLLEKIKEAPLTAKVKIFTNIPQRYNEYYNEWARNKASEQIDNYITKLDPEKFKEKFQSFFVFDNHSKIIMTNNIAYIGSANYSSESARNIESGVIFDEAHVILQIKNIVDEIITNSSVPYYAYNLFSLIFLTRELEVLKTRINKDVWDIWEAQGREYGSYYKGINIDLNIQSLDAFEDFKEELKHTIWLLISDIENIGNYQSANIIDKLLELQDTILEYKIDSEVIDLVEFDEDAYIEKEVSDNGIYITEADVLDEYVQIITRKASEIKDELASDAQDSLASLIEFLNEAIELIMDIFNECKIYISEEIDNTK